MIDMKKVLLSLTLILVVVGAQVVLAQYSDPWYSSYQVQNLGGDPADIIVNYYDSAGAVQTSASKSFTDVPANGSVTVVQFTDDPNLAAGTYSAVISADQPIAAIANQQLVPTGATAFTPSQPFSSYSGASAGSTTVIIPVIMYNWFGYYTEMYIQNVGSAGASNVDITFYPTTVNGELAGTSGVTDNDNAIAQYASGYKSQESLSALGAASGTWADRFLGAAVITSDQPLVVVVNQHNPTATKLFTFNGFGSGASEDGAPVYMRGYYDYYASLTIANTSLTTAANVTIKYQADATHSTVANGSVTVNYTIPAGESINRYDGPGASDDQSDLDDSPVFDRFFGTVTITSDQPVVAVINQESTADGQAGTYGAIATGEATTKISVPLIQADFYGYYTSLTIQSATGASGTVNITYTSDDVYSANKNTTKMYTHSIGAAPLNIYEGRKGGIEIGDINSDDATWGAATTNRFIGAAVIESTVPIIAFVNEEFDIGSADSMYTFNTFNLNP